MAQVMVSLWKIEKLAGNSSYRGEFQWNLDEGKENLVQVSRESELSGFCCSFVVAEKMQKFNVKRKLSCCFLKQQEIKL